MELEAVLRRIEERLAQMGRSASAVSREAGKPYAIQNLRRAVRNGGRSGISTATLTALAAALGKTDLCIYRRNSRARIGPSAGGLAMTDFWLGSYLAFRAALRIAPARTSAYLCVHLS